MVSIDRCRCQNLVSCGSPCGCVFRNGGLIRVGIECLAEGLAEGRVMHKVIVLIFVANAICRLSTFNILAKQPREQPFEDRILL